MLAYIDSEPEDKHTSSYETDILIYEKHHSGRWFPRVVIECKLAAVTTHDALTYSAKALTHKNVHPYLRYGILLGDWGHSPIPPRLVRHGTHFDFMATWFSKDANPSEWTQLVEVLQEEIGASRILQEMLSSRKRAKARHSILHRPLKLRS